MDVLITIDLEASSYRGKPLPFSKMVYGEIDGNSYGFQLIMDICERYGARATFFVDVFEHANVGELKLKTVCNEIINRGHSVELHTHPSRIWDKECMKDYSLDEQIEIIRKGKNLLKKWTGESPIAHRAGSFGADNNTIIALKRNGFKVDSSHFNSYPHCNLNMSIINQVSYHEGILQVPPTLFTALRIGTYKSVRNFDIDACTLSELKYIIKKGKEHGLQTLTLLLHSFSFVKRNFDSTEFSADEKDIKRFIRLLEFLSKHTDVRFSTMKEIFNSYHRNPSKYDKKDYVPYTGILRTFVRACKRWRNSKKNQLFILIVLSLPIIILMLIFIII